MSLGGPGSCSYSDMAGGDTGFINHWGMGY
jgi:hypothetical protein